MHLYLRIHMSPHTYMHKFVYSYKQVSITHWNSTRQSLIKSTLLVEPFSHTWIPVTCLPACHVALRPRLSDTSDSNILPCLSGSTGDDGGSGGSGGSGSSSGGVLSHTWSKVHYSHSPPTNSRRSGGGDSGDGGGGGGSSTSDGDGDSGSPTVGLPLLLSSMNGVGINATHVLRCDPTDTSRGEEVSGRYGM